MWIVRLALERPYTFIVMALLILIVSSVAILRTPVDIFPDINIPVISVIWQFNGLSPQEMADRIVSNTERGLTTTVNDIEHVESQAMDGRAIEKIFASQCFHHHRGRKHAIGLARRLHPCGNVDRIAPDIVGELARADDSRHDRTRMQPHPDRERDREPRS